MIRLALTTAILACCAMIAEAGIIVLPTSTTPGFVRETDAPNNDDYRGPLDRTAHPNWASFNSQLPEVETMDHLEGVIPVVDSGGTTEYGFEVGFRTPEPWFEVPWHEFIDDKEAYVLQLGFGTGDHFVPASTVFSDLDFDAPLPSDPAIPIKIPDDIPPASFPPTFMRLKSHEADTLTWSLHGSSSTIALFGTFLLPLDVPDLPASVMDYYQPEDLPADFPDGAKAFTIRGYFIERVPEPAAGVLMLLAAGGALTSFRGRRRPGAN